MFSSGRTAALVLAGMHYRVRRNTPLSSRTRLIQAGPVCYCTHPSTGTLFIVPEHDRATIAAPSVPPPEPAATHADGNFCRSVAPKALAPSAPFSSHRD